MVSAPRTPAAGSAATEGCRCAGSRIIDILRHQERQDGSAPEGVWLTDRLGHRPSQAPNGTVSIAFSGEMNSGEVEHIDSYRKYNKTLEAAMEGDYVKGIDDRREGFHEPMGYHTGGSGTAPPFEASGAPPNSESTSGTTAPRLR